MPEPLLNLTKPTGMVAKAIQHILDHNAERARREYDLLERASKPDDVLIDTLELQRNKDDADQRLLFAILENHLSNQRFEYRGVFTNERQHEDHHEVVDPQDGQKKEGGHDKGSSARH